MDGLQDPASADAAVAAAAQVLTARLHQLLSPSCHDGSESGGSGSSCGSSSGGSSSGSSGSSGSNTSSAADSGGSSAAQEVVGLVAQLLAAAEASKAAAVQHHTQRLQQALDQGEQERREWGERLQRAEVGVEAEHICNSRAAARAALLQVELNAVQARAAAAEMAAAARGIRLAGCGTGVLEMKGKIMALCLVGPTPGELGPFRNQEEAHLALDLLFVARACLEHKGLMWATAEAWEAIAPFSCALDWQTMQPLVEACAQTMQAWTGDTAVQGPPAAAFLHAASALGTTALVQLLLALYPNCVAAVNGAGRTACHVAAAGGHAAVIRVLVAAVPALADQADPDDYQPVHAAAQGGHAAAVQALLHSSPGTATFEDSSGAFPLHLAAAAGRMAAIQPLIAAAPAVLNWTDGNGQLPIHLAAHCGDPAGLQLLIAAAQDTCSIPDATGRCPLHHACAGGHVAAAHLLLRIAPQVASSLDSLGSLPLHLAAGSGNPWLCAMVLAAAPDASMQQDDVGAVPLAVAAQAGHEAAVRVLLQAAPAAVATMDAAGRTPLAQACTQGHCSCAWALLRADADAALAADDDGFMPHHLAAYGGHADVLSMLLASGPPWLASMPSFDGGWTAAHLAAQAGHLAALDVVLGRAPATALQPSDIGWLPLHSACEFGTPRQHLVIILLLVETPEAAAVCSQDGQLPVQVALEHGHVEAARSLLPYAPSQAVLRALRAAGEAAQQLFADFVLAEGRLPLSLADWSLMPMPCPSLQHALRATLAHSPCQAGLLVRRLPAALQRRLRTFALALARVQRRLGLQLPPLLVQRLLGLTFVA